MNTASNKSGNSLITGLIPGLVVPLLTFILFFMVRSAGQPRLEYFQAMNEVGITPKLLALSLLPNVIVFFYFLRGDKYQSARGLILSLFIYGLVILILKFF